MSVILIEYFTGKASDIATNPILSLCGNGEISEIVKVDENEPKKKTFRFFSMLFRKKLQELD